MKICVINYADKVFIKGQDRLRRSLQDINFMGDTLFFDHLLPGWQAHEKVPWGFKVYAFEEARKKGYAAAIWIDSAGIVIRSLSPIIKKLEKDGIFAFSRYNASVGEWSSDYALKALNISREQAFKIPEISAFCIGINFNHEKGKNFLKEWKKHADDGISFLGLPIPYTVKDSLTNIDNLVSKDARVRGHRHDQTVASVLLNKLNIKPTRYYIFDLIGESKDGKSYASYIPLDTIIVQNRDIKTDTFLKDLSLYTVPWREKNILFISKIVYRSLLRYTKDTVKWYLFTKKRFDQ